MAAPAPAANHGERITHRGPTTASNATATTATNATCGFASNPTPASTPAASSDGPLCRMTARINIQHTAVVLNKSKVVVVTKCPVANANPDTAAHDAAMTCARARPPISRATKPASTVVAAAITAEGSRSTSGDPGAR